MDCKQEKETTGCGPADRTDGQHGTVSADVFYQRWYGVRYAGMGITGADFFLVDFARETMRYYIHIKCIKKNFAISFFHIDFILYFIYCV